MATEKLLQRLLKREQKQCEEQLQATNAQIAALKAQVAHCRMMAQLTPREREVLNKRFGIK